MNIEKWLKNNTKNLDGKYIAITGATGDLGEQVCIYLTMLNANLILLTRNIEKTKILTQKLKKINQQIEIISIQIDMLDMKSVKNACEKLKVQKIDYFIHNAGAYKLERQKTEQGYDNVFQSNFIAPYYISKQLLNHGCKMIVVGSISYKTAKLQNQDIDYSNCKNVMKVYGNSKRFLMFSLEELTKVHDVKYAIAHPGIVYTNITSHYPKCIKWFVKFAMKLIFHKPKKASLAIIKAVFEDCPQNTWFGPWLLGIWGKPKNKKLKISKSEQQQIFDHAEMIYENCN